MRRTFIKKEGVVITTLARYLLGEKCGNRLKTIDELANECRSSVGLTQAALKTLESSGAIRIERRGRNGSYLVEMWYVQCPCPLPVCTKAWRAD